MKHEPHPLDWPIGLRRTPPAQRRSSSFRALAFGRVRADLLAELRRLKASAVVLSTNVPARLDGLPYASWRQPEDPGVAVYFQRGPKPYALACDAYRRIEENLRALVATLEAIRTIERHGSAGLLEQALSGFAELPPAAPTERPWWAVLGFAGPVSVAAAESQWRRLVVDAHPDRGGSVERMQELNRAIESARRAHA